MERIEVKDIVAKAKAGDPGAFEQLIAEHMQCLYKTAYAMLRNDEDAADAIQETILSCWQKLPQLREDQYFRTWLTRILINHCNAMLRTRSKVRPLELAPEPSAPSRASANLEFNEAVGVLDEKYRLPIVLHYAIGFKTSEIAQMLEVPDSTVTTWLARGRKQLEAYYLAATSEGAV